MMRFMNVKNTLREMGLTLPPPPRAVADYVPAVESRGHLYVSGQLPLASGELIATGKVGAEIDLATARRCAEQCVLNGLAILDSAIGGDYRGRFGRVVRLGVFVASAPGFTDHHLVANGASELIGKVFGDRGKHARAAVGCASLPLDAPVEVELLIALADAGGLSD